MGSKEKKSFTTELLEKELDRLLWWIRAVETKMSLVLLLSTTMLGALAVLTPTFSGWSIFPGITSAFATFFLVLSIIFSALASFPRTSGPKGSIIYFGGIASMELDQYRLTVTNLSSDDYTEDLIRQCHRNAQIAERKYTWIQRALGSLFISALPWVISIYLLYSIQV